MTTALSLILALLAIVGGLTVVLTRDVMRLILGLGLMLLSVAGLFGVLGAPFLTVAEIFVYVGGVLVLFLFGIMLVHRSEADRPELGSRHDPLSFVLAAGSFGMILLVFEPLVGSTPLVALQPSMDALGATLTGPLLPHFEAAGVLLLAALVAVVAILGGDRR